MSSEEGSESKPDWNVVFVLGPPGCGKGTQCKRIVQKFGYLHLSAGELLRNEQSSPGSIFKDLIEHHIREGTIVPVEITCRLLEKAMQRADGVAGYVIDGFPRNQDNLEGWNRHMSDRVNVQFVLFMDCPTEICVNRCLNRGQGRTDDNKESLAKRIETYRKNTLPIIKYFESMNLVRQVNAACDPDQTFKQVERAFSAY
uniref:UMP-CMP kinase n=1 Tax=Trichuris muris TaxID=70415 RepID=A0A5S6QDS0_TRIMR